MICKALLQAGLQQNCLKYLRSVENMIPNALTPIELAELQANSHRNDLGSEAQSMCYGVLQVSSFSFPYPSRKEEAVALHAATGD